MRSYGHRPQCFGCPSSPVLVGASLALGPSPHTGVAARVEHGVGTIAEHLGRAEVGPAVQQGQQRAVVTLQRLLSTQRDISAVRVASI